MSITPLDAFTGRDRVLTKFRDALRNARPKQLQMLAIKGNSGSGKTFLIEYLSKRICTPANWQTGHLSFAQNSPDFRSILESLEDGLKNCVSLENLKEYRVARDAYKRSFDEYRTGITVNLNMEAHDASTIQEASLHAQININLLQRELQLRSELSRALLELAEESMHPLCVFIDDYERLSETSVSLIDWLWDDLLLKMGRNMPQPLLIVTCGWRWPNNTTVQPFSQQETLDDFDRSGICSYLYKYDVLTSDMPEITKNKLITAFYDLSKGHPLVLSLAVAYFNELPLQERNAASLHARRNLIDEQARVSFLEERLLSRLPEPYCTLLEYCPILRSFDQTILGYLLGVKDRGKAAMALLDDNDKDYWESQAQMNYEGTPMTSKIDDRSYEYFLHYPFITQEADKTLLRKPMFHSVVRRVRLEALRRHHPDTWRQLHLGMAGYYKRIVNAEEKFHGTWWDIKVTIEEGINDARWALGIAEEEFAAWIEFFYHGLQVTQFQEVVFSLWMEVIGLSLRRGQLQQAKSLLVVVEQVIDEKEPFLNKNRDSYGSYLIRCAQFSRQVASHKEAQNALKTAIRIFERTGNKNFKAVCLLQLGYIHFEQSRLEEALSYYQLALTCNQETPTLLSNIGHIYLQQKRFEQALDYFQRALLANSHKSDLEATANILNNIGGVYTQQKQFDKALEHFQTALGLFEKVGNPDDTVMVLNNIGGIFKQKSQISEALVYFRKALELSERTGNTAGIAISLNHIGENYIQEGNLNNAFTYYQRVLLIKDHLNDKIDLATALGGIGYIHEKRGDISQALVYLKRSVKIYENIHESEKVASTSHEIARLHRCLNEWESAIEFYSKSLNGYRDMGPGFERDCFGELGGLMLCYRALKRVEDEQKCIEQAKLILEMLSEQQQRDLLAELLE
jgi:tetratricopeptide (TPR) repeat protein